MGTGIGDASIGASPGLGLYIHVPFCSSRCDYCAFSTFTDRAGLIEDYVAACCRQLRELRAGLDGEAIETIFVGGGTPSLLAPGQVAALLEAAGAEAAGEVTIEANPESASAALLEAARGAGATRLSLGVQSLHSHVLGGLGRTEHRGALEAALEAACAAGFEELSVDLIYGGAGETTADWIASLTGVFDLVPGLCHLSAYALTIEHGTPLAHDRARHPDDDTLAERYLLADELLAERGLCWYEISNWAVPGHECRHNLACWRHGEYLAVGSAAHGHRHGVRFANVALPEAYIERIGSGRSPVAREFPTTEDEATLEGLELLLRTRAGVPAGALDQGDEALSGLVEPEGERLVLTLRGRLLANEVAIRLRAPQPAT